MGNEHKNHSNMGATDQGNFAVSAKVQPESEVSNMELLSESEAKSLMRRIDMRVLPTLFIIYVAAFLDRANISNALTMSMPKELGLSGDQPNVALAVFFVPYIIFEIPSNILMKKFKPHIWLSLCVAGFGIVTIAQGFVRNYAGLITTRFFLGFFEAGVFPGSFYLISFWYKQEEAQKRFTFYFCSVIIASSFGGLLATGIANMNNVRGLSNWRWIFILEGIGTVLVGAASYFFIVDFPSDAKWLSESERQFVLQRTRTSESSSERVTWKDMGQFFRDPKNILAAIMYFSVVVPIYAFAYFTPTIVKTLGYSVIQTQLHSVPPFAAALGFCLVLAILSDYTNKRVPYVLFGSVTLIAGLAILMTNHTNFSVRYAGICLVCMGAYGAAPMIVCWYLMNLQGHKQRSIGSGWMISFGNTGGILAPFTFLTKFAPYYRTGYSVCMAVVALGTISIVSYATLIILERRKVSDNGGKLRGLAL